MSSVLDPSALADSPLADLHLLANELGVDGFRRLRKADLIDAIVAKQAGEDYVAPEPEPEPESEPESGRGRARAGTRPRDPVQGRRSPHPTHRRARPARVPWS
jgi:transcription termination factor Rho